MIAWKNTQFDPINFCVREYKLLQGVVCFCSITIVLELL